MDLTSSTYSNFFVVFITQVARKYLFIDPKRKAIAYLAIVFVLSLIADYMPLPNHYYFVQKHNVFNRFGPKLGWFWTLLLTTPFIYLTSILHHGSKAKALRDMCRMVVATGVWYFATTGFLRFERHTQYCHGATHALRDNCVVEGGKWIPGFDISGHTFLLIYCVLVICEEASSFRNWPTSPRATPQHVPSRREQWDFKSASKAIQLLFIAMFVLHVLWDIQLVITILYYHAFSHKLLAVVIAVGGWFFTYRTWYPIAFPFSPIRRHVKSF